MERKNVITNSERRIRLTQYDKERLYSLLYLESGLKERLEECRDRVSEYCEKLIFKYLFTERMIAIFPKSTRISRRIQRVTIVFCELNIDIPKFKKEDLVPKIDDYIEFNLKTPIPNIFNEKTIWFRNSPNFFTDSTFIARIKKVASDIEMKTLKSLVYEYIECLVESVSFLKEERWPSKSNWKKYIDFGNYYTLGTLYDHNQEYGLRMKYDILLLEDVELTDGEKMDFKKHPSEISLEKNIERVKCILNL